MKRFLAFLLLILGLAATPAALADVPTSNGITPETVGTAQNCEPVHCYRFGYSRASGQWASGYKGASAIVCIASSAVPNGTAHASGSGTEDQMVNSELWVFTDSTDPNLYYMEGGVTDGNSKLGRHLFLADKTTSGFTWTWGPAASAGVGYKVGIYYNGGWHMQITDPNTGSVLMSTTGSHSNTTASLIESGSEWDDTRVTAQDESWSTLQWQVVGGDQSGWPNAGSVALNGPGSGTWFGAAGSTPYLSVAGTGSYGSC